MATTQAHTYADGFGRWHCDVKVTRGDFAEPTIAHVARTLIRAEILLRENGPIKPTRVKIEHRVNGDDSVVYRFTER